ncbi:hypothetical protein HZI73_22220 [Vallitalea pronyensis]|uniref:Uncharacterized protein n=1 Tax=Vallitalea pronyensis TaxID=1348613 RepID=A0A8J8MP84_9FIRM|nr:hypothetical protein [Vallitalea pronyensis]QUI24848.1 hypothetical protein HZI73_22220 [Vallitalea pronyensis]
MALTKAQLKAVQGYCYNEEAKRKYVTMYCSYQCIDCQRLICNGGKCYGKKQVSECQGYVDKSVSKIHLEANDIAKNPNGILCYVKKVVGDRCLVLEQFQDRWYPLSMLELFKSHRECSWGNGHR